MIAPPDKAGPTRARGTTKTRLAMKNSMLAVPTWRMTSPIMVPSG
jgi:hypothetical protein